MKFPDKPDISDRFSSAMLSNQDISENSKRNYALTRPLRMRTLAEIISAVKRIYRAIWSDRRLRVQPTPSQKAD